MQRVCLCPCSMFTQHRIRECQFCVAHSSKANATHTMQTTPVATARSGVSRMRPAPHQQRRGMAKLLPPAAEGVRDTPSAKSSRGQTNASARAATARFNTADANAILTTELLQQKPWKLPKKLLGPRTGWRVALEAYSHQRACHCFASSFCGRRGPRFRRSDPTFRSTYSFK